MRTNGDDHQEDDGTTSHQRVRAAVGAIVASAEAAKVAAGRVGGDPQATADYETAQQLAESIERLITLELADHLITQFTENVASDDSQ